MHSQNSGRTVVTDGRFRGNESDTRYDNHVFIRLSAKGRTFRNVDFKYTTFDSCYLRDAQFDSCNFTGCRFISTNLYGAKFSGCQFDYATFERTAVEPNILDTECPSRENLKQRFARTLRMNFQQLGDSAAVNKAMQIELQATGTHYFKSWSSNEEYYRRKYRGVLWFKALFNWMAFSLGDIIWGNGESPLRLVRSVIFILLVMTVYQVFSFSDPRLAWNYWSSLINALDVFMGVESPSNYPKPYIASVTFIRLISIGFLLSIILKRYNRR